MSKGNKAGFFKDVEYRDPLLAGRSDANFVIGVLRKLDLLSSTALIPV